MKKTIVHCTFLRHANAEPVRADSVDRLRELSQTGVEQALRTGYELKKTEFAYVFCSTALRAVETAKKAIDYDLNLSAFCWPLYGGDMKDLEDMFALYGYAPLSKYLADAKAEALINYSKNVAKIIKGTLGVLMATDTMKDKEEINVLIAGHAVSLNSIAYYLADFEKNPDDIAEEHCLERVLGEAEYMQINVVLD